MMKKLTPQEIKEYQKILAEEKNMHVSYEEAEYLAEKIQEYLEILPERLEQELKPVGWLKSLTKKFGVMR